GGEVEIRLMNVADRDHLGIGVSQKRVENLIAAVAQADEAEPDPIIRASDSCCDKCRCGGRGPDGRGGLVEIPTSNTSHGILLRRGVRSHAGRGNQGYNSGVRLRAIICSRRPAKYAWSSEAPCDPHEPQPPLVPHELQPPSPRPQFGLPQPSSICDKSCNSICRSCRLDKVLTKGRMSHSAQRR